MRLHYAVTYTIELLGARLFLSINKRGFSHPELGLIAMFIICMGPNKSKHNVNASQFYWQGESFGWHKYLSGNKYVLIFGRNMYYISLPQQCIYY